MYVFRGCVTRECDQYASVREQSLNSSHVFCREGPFRDTDPLVEVGGRSRRWIPFWVVLSAHFSIFKHVSRIAGNPGLQYFFIYKVLP